MKDSDESPFGEVIYAYTRAQAIADGVLVDVSTVAREAGIIFPVALTRAVWEKCVTIPCHVRNQDEEGRLWDVLWMLFAAIRVGRSGAQTLRYQLYVRSHNRPQLTRRDLVTLKAECGRGDAGEPVLTVMLPDED
jgi:hypothetical protein